MYDMTLIFLPNLA